MIRCVIGHSTKFVVSPLLYLGCATPSSMMKAAAAGTAHQGFPAAAQMFGISALGGGKVSSSQIDQQC